MGLSSIGKLIPGAARRAGISRNLAITEALRACQAALQNVFGVDYSKFAEAGSLRQDGVLVVTCRSSAVAQTLRLREREILETVRQECPQLTINRLFLVPRSKEDIIQY
ncbi:MAG: DUF721 domain-containing protein [Candidatus Uhrbacteria bacterium]